uniref:LAGLIDADG endonuclease n=1 Tax=Juglanconis sp. TaxID=2041886 RepID=A0A291LIB5_9PEZI|nr:LAGLIDADG endonuclease [Juglanconis sp.]
MNVNISKIKDISSYIPLCFSPSPVLQRSTKGIKRLSSSERALLEFPDEVKEILVGILLGDAHIVRRSSTANSRLVYAQTAVTHKEYFDYVLSFFLPYCVNDYTPQSRIVRDNRTKKTYSAISFTTMQLPCFNEFKNNFYKLNVKLVPDNIYELLTPSPPRRGPFREGSRQGRGLAFLLKKNIIEGTIKFILSDIY